MRRQHLEAENGEKALKILEREPGVDLVLTDIMMPVMDGYETMKRIRAQDRFASLPDHRIDREGDDGGPGEVHRGGGRATICPSRWTRTGSSPC